MADNASPEAPQTNETKLIQPKKIYLKDVSFEAPNSPAIFTKKWAPEMKIEIQATSSEIEPDVYEIVIVLTVTTSTGGEIAYLAEVHQAGIFTTQGFNEQELHRKLYVVGPRTLHPYALVAISQMVSNGGFPQLILGPVNFQRLYNNQLLSLGKTSEEATEANDSEQHAG